MTTPSSSKKSPAEPVVRLFSNEEFCDEIRKSVRKGGGLTPLVGSGISVQSGILMGQEFNEYLAYVVYACVAKTESKPEGETPRKRWNLRTDGWPPHPIHTEMLEAKKWCFEKLIETYDRAGLEVERGKDTFAIKKLSYKAGAVMDGLLPNHLRLPLLPVIFESKENEAAVASLAANQTLIALHKAIGGAGLHQGGRLPEGFSPTSSEMTEDQAVRCLYDWRATLAFLSRLHLLSDDRLLVDKPETDVIDQFHQHITRNRRPNLTHVMLCHLCRAVRGRVILTTNFDKLIEEAFDELGEPLDDIPVNQSGRLPSPEIVHSRNMVIKLHGSITETRADFTLDESPALADKNRFFHFVRGGYPGDSKKGYLPTDLLVVGFSGRDVRIIEMMKYILDFDREAKIYWVCHSKRDLERLEKNFQEASYKKHVIATVCQRPDILFYEMFQTITLSQPPGGVGHQLTEALPPKSFESPYVGGNSALGSAKSLRDRALCMAEKIAHAKEPLQQSGGNSEGTVIVINNGTGVLPGMEHYASENYQGKTLWLEMEDYFDMRGLMFGLFQFLATSTGAYRTGHICYVPRDLYTKKGSSFEERVVVWKTHIEKIVDSLRADPSRWLICLYGRNGPGGCVGWEDKDDNYWKADGPDYGSTKEGPGLVEVCLEALRRVGFHCIYAPNCPDQVRFGTANGNVTKIPIHDIGLISRLHQSNSGWKLIDLPKVAEAIVTKLQESYESKIESFLNDSGQDKNHRQFLYVASLFRQSRHQTALLRTATIPRPYPFSNQAHDNDLEADKLLQEAIMPLNEAPMLFLPKIGSYKWLYKSLRVRLRETGDEDLRKQRAQFELLIGDWYLRAFYVTGHANPMMEALYHFYQAALHAKDLEGDEQKMFIWRKSVVRITQALKEGRDAIFYWLGPPMLRAWFDPKHIELVCTNLSAPGSDGGELLKYARTMLEDMTKTVERHYGLAKSTPKSSPEKSESKTYTASPSSRGIPSPQVEGLAGLILQRVFNGLGTRIDPALMRRVDETLPQRSLSDSELLQHLAHLADEWVGKSKLQTQACFDRDPKTWTPQLLPWKAEKLQEDSAWKKVAQSWQQVSVLAVLAIEVQSYLLPGTEQWGNLEKCKAQMSYGLSHARLFRFTSAHRIFNQAQALLPKMPKLTATTQLGILELRRAEAHLIEAQIVRELEAKFIDANFQPNFKGMGLPGLATWYDRFQTKASPEQTMASPDGSSTEREALFKYRCAKIDDAWRCLENSTRFLGHHTHSPKWWTRLLSLHIRTFALVPTPDEAEDAKTQVPRLLPFRIERDLPDYLWRLARQARDAEPGTWQNRARTLDYLMRALLNAKECREFGESPALPEILETFIKDEFQHIQEIEPEDNDLSPRLLEKIQGAPKFVNPSN